MQVEYAMGMVIRSGINLKFLPEIFRGNENIVVAAMKDSIDYIEFAGDELKNNKKFALRVVGNYGGVLEYLSLELRGDKEVVMAAVKLDGWALVYASNELRADKEVVLEAVKYWGLAYSSCLENMQRDPDVIDFANQKLKEYGKSVDDYLCDELVELKRKYGVNTLGVALEMEVAELEFKHMQNKKGVYVVSNRF